jgi:hypothetical protein
MKTKRHHDSRRPRLDLPAGLHLTNANELRVAFGRDLDLSARQTGGVSDFHLDRVWASRDKLCARQMPFRAKALRELTLVGLMVLAVAMNALAQPVITSQPQNQTNIAGSTAMFTVGATGTPPLTYQWRSYANSTTFTNIPWGTNDMLALSNVQPTTRKFGVVVTNVEGAVTSVLASLTVLVPPTITAQPTNFLRLSLGASVSNRVTASGTTPLFYQWQLNGTNLPNRTNALIVLTNLQLAHVGDYTVIVTNAAGSTNSQVARLNIDPAFTKITTGRVVTDLATSLGVTWGDCDNDGWLDLFVPNTTAFPSPNGGGDYLYRNNRDGTFSFVTNAGVGADMRDSPDGVWGDYDNDGFLDLFVSDFGQNCSLFHNNGNGSFTKITTGSLVTLTAWFDGAAWGDYDNDGFVDLFIANGNTAQASRWANFLYRNNGDGTFSRITSGNIVTDLGVGRGSAWGDFDNDGRLDLFASNAYFITNFLYRNNGNGTFARITSGPIGTDLGDSRGCVWGDYDNDGYLDMFVANGGRTSSQSSFLYHNNGDGTFTKITSGSIVNDGGHSIGCVWGDYDNDGFLDVFVANIGGENNFLYHNNGDGSFTKVTTGSLVNDGGESCGCAWGDYDNDGFLDLIVGNGGNPLNGNPPDSHNFLYRNSGNSNSWLTLKLVGTVSNRSAIGAKVRLKAFFAGATRWQLRQISGGDGVGGQNGLRAHFGLGNATNIDAVRIEWPSGTVQELRDVAVKQFLTVKEPPRLCSPGITNGVFSFALKGGRGFQYDIQSSSNALDWASAGSVTVTNFSGNTTFSEPADVNARSRFYRAVSP